jgi:hypothetical protein
MHILILALLTAAGPVEARELMCPAELPASTITVSHPPPEWTGFVPAKLMLNSVGVSLGPLEDRATLIGDCRKRRGGAFTVTFSLKGAKNDDRWLMCQYGSSNDIVIAKRLARSLTTCTVCYVPTRFGDNTISIACR